MRQTGSTALRAARTALHGLGERGRTTRVPPAVRRAVLAYVAAARAEGRPWGRIAEAVGLSESALRRWREEEDGGEPCALLPVAVIAEHEARRGAHAGPLGVGDALTLVSPRGYRVEGLGVEQVATLLARIGE